MAKIRSLESGHFRIPLATTLTDATHGEMPDFELITVRIADADGIEGVGYTYTAGHNGAAVAATLAHEMPNIVHASDADLIDMKIAHLAEAFNLKVTSHGAHDVSVQLLAACPNRSYLEAHGFGLENYLLEPFEMQGSNAVASNRPGHGVDFDWAALQALKA